MLICRFKAQSQPHKTEQVREVLEAAIGPSRAVDGVIAFDIAQDLADPNAFVATEVYEDRAALDRQESIPEVGKVMAVLGESLAGPPEVTLFHVSSSEERAL